MFRIVAFFIAYWILLALFAYYNIRKVLTFYRNLPKISIKQEWKGFLRDDLGKWDQRTIIIGCFTRFPFALTILGFFLITFLVLIPLSKFFGQKGKELVINFEKKYGNWAIRQVFNIQEQEDYQKYEIETPIVISNHINWFDIWFIGITFMPMSIVSKLAIKKTPIIGGIADFFDTIYVNRASQNQNQRDTVMEKITERIEKFNQNKNKKQSQKTNPLIIFPEGTTSNGKSILTFKIGAFHNLSSITMFGLKYKSKYFEMGMGDISQAHHVFISLCLKPTLEVKHKVMRPLDGETAQQYCMRCRKEMSKMTGFQMVESRFRDYLEYQKAIDEAIKLKTERNVEVSKKD